ncbi:predicted protein [Histoplasma capsulatum H143]|uniref:Uncharacterized protein n=1 Tax=Ajellomyces capsulatus (strain H143) TaxID=544712 RepID=C6H787_AJECH|nr:predicted protein [Histoplasma capsulatum H143]
MYFSTLPMRKGQNPERGASSHRYKVRSVLNLIALHTIDEDFDFFPVPRNRAARTGEFLWVNCYLLGTGKGDISGKCGVDATVFICRAPVDSSIPGASGILKELTPISMRWVAFAILEWEFNLNRASFQRENNHVNDPKPAGFFPKDLGVMFHSVTSARIRGASGKCKADAFQSCYFPAQRGKTSSGMCRRTSSYRILEEGYAVLRFPIRATHLWSELRFPIGIISRSSFAL